MIVFCCVTFHLLGELRSYSVFGTDLSPSLTVGMLAIRPGVSQALFSPGHQSRSTDVRSQDCSIMDLAWPIPHVYVLKVHSAKLDPSQL